MNFLYTRGETEIANGNTNLLTSDLRVLLLQSTYTPDTTHHTVSDIVGFEVAVSGYSRQALSGRSIGTDEANNFSYLSANDVTFAALGAGAVVQYAALYRHTGNDATAPLIALYQLAKSATNGTDIVVQWASAVDGKVLKLGGVATASGNTGGVNDWAEWSMVVWNGNALTPPRFKSSGSVVLLDGGVILTQVQYTAGAALDVTATFSGAPFQHIGFAVDLVNAPWAIFSSKGGDQLYVRTLPVGGVASTDAPLGAGFFGTSHRYRVEWTALAINYLIDDVVVATHALALAAPMNVMASDFAQDGTILTIAAMRVS